MAEAAQTKSRTQSKETESNAPRFRLPKQVARFQKRVLEGQRSAFDSGFQAFDSFEEWREDRLRSWLEQSSWVPTEIGEIAGAWIDTGRTSRSNLRQAVDRSFHLAESYLSRLAEEEAAN